MSSLRRDSYWDLSSAVGTAFDSAMTMTIHEGRAEAESKVETRLEYLCLLCFKGVGLRRRVRVQNELFVISVFITISTPAMSSAPPPSNPPTDSEKKPEGSAPSTSSNTQDNADMDTTPDVQPEETWDDIPEDIMALTTDEIATRTRLIDNDLKVMRSETQRLQHEQSVMKEKIRDNSEKIKQNKVLPYLVGHIVEVRIWRLWTWMRS